MLIVVVGQKYNLTIKSKKSSTPRLLTITIALVEERELKAAEAGKLNLWDLKRRKNKAEAQNLKLVPRSRTTEGGWIDRRGLQW